MEKWRVFVGLLDEDGTADWAHVDETYDDWATARDRLRAELTEFINPEGDRHCADCLRQGAEMLAKVDAAQPGEPIGKPGWDWVDGEDYLVLAVS